MTEAKDSAGLRTEQPCAPIDLDALERLHAAATPGPWRSYERGRKWPARGIVAGESVNTTRICQTESVIAYAANAAVIVAAVNALPALIAAARERDALREELSLLRAVAEAAEALPVDAGFVLQCGCEPNFNHCPRCDSRRSLRVALAAWRERGRKT